MKINYSKGAFLDFNLSDIQFFMGGNSLKKRYIFQSLNRFFDKKSLSETEENVYGDSGPQIYLQNRSINNRSVDAYFITQLKDIFDVFELKKDRLLYKEIQELQVDFKVQKAMDILNESLVTLELVLQEEINQYFNGLLKLEIGTIPFTDLLAKYFFVFHTNDKINFPIEWISPILLIDEFCYLLEAQARRTAKEMWIIIQNPTNFFEPIEIDYFIQKLRKISKKLTNLKTFIFSDEYLPITYFIFDIEKTILLGEVDVQLPEFEIFRKSISNHYPDHLQQMDKELVEQFYRVVPYLENNIYSPYLLEKDMVLFEVMMDLLDYRIVGKKKLPKMSKLESDYLSSKVRKY